MKAKKDTNNRPFASKVQTIPPQIPYWASHVVLGHMKIEGGEDANIGPLTCDINVPFNFHLGRACQKIWAL